MTTAPTFRAAGALYNATVGGTVLSPAGLATDDIELMVIESQAGTHSMTTANGFAQLGSQIDVPSGTATIATHGSLWWRRYAGQSDPVVANATNHVIARRAAYIGVDTATAFDTIFGGGFTRESSEAVEDTSGTVTGSDASTTVDNCLCLIIVGAAKPDSLSTTEFGSFTNGALSSTGESFDSCGNAGNGGGICTWRGVLATAGTIGDTTYTKATASFKWGYLVALMPIPDAGGGIQIARAGAIGV